MAAFTSVRWNLRRSVWDAARGIRTRLIVALMQIEMRRSSLRIAACRMRCDE
jgi:hypothetical protein